MHLSQQEKENFQTGSLSVDETIAFLKHLEDCSYCMEQVFDELTPNETPAPAYLRQQILEKAASPGIRIERKAYAFSKKMQIAICCMQTAVGVIAALFLLFALEQTDISLLSQKQMWSIRDFNSVSRQYNQEFQAKTQQITTYINQLFSQQ